MRYLLLYRDGTIRWYTGTQVDQPEIKLCEKLEHAVNGTYIRRFRPSKQGKAVWVWREV